jgi:hypothetical protein
MRRTWTIIGVADVSGSFKWYQALLGLPQAAPAHDHFGQTMEFSLRDPDGCYVTINAGGADARAAIIQS